jgi:hypothetical protein
MTTALWRHPVTALMDDVMAEPERRTMPVRLGHEAIEAAKIAASLKGMSLAEYATTVLLEMSNRDIDEWARARQQGQAKRKGGSK